MKFLEYFLILVFNELQQFQAPCVNPLSPWGLRSHNVSSSNFQWQIFSRVKQISIFGKLGSYRVTSLHTCCTFQFPKYQCEKYLKII